MFGQRVCNANLTLAVLFLAAWPSAAQVIRFRSSGLEYQALTKQGLTLMFARMPLTAGRYSVLQVALNNGSLRTWEVEATDFYFEAEDGMRVRAVSEQAAVGDFFRNAGRSALLELQTVYEKALYNNEHIRSNNGYEQRRKSALAIGPKGLKAAAAASAIAFVSGKIGPGDSTDGAVFFPTGGRSLGPGKVIARLGGERFEFLSQEPPPARHSR